MNDAGFCEFARRQIAFHEAGHAIVLWSFRIKVTRLTVWDEGDGETGAESTNHLSEPDRIAILMAGAAGAEFGSHPYPSLDHVDLASDKKKAEKLVLSMPTKDDADRDSEIRKMLDEGLDTARGIIKSHHASFNQVADRLFERGELRADEIAALLPEDNS